jgi:hypothetical protein
MTEYIQPILIICAVLIGAASVSYFYFSTDVFTNILKRPLKMISGGMFAIDLGVILVAYIAYQQSQGRDVEMYGIPLSTLFYALFFLGSLMVIFGSRKFSSKP